MSFVSDTDRLAAADLHAIPQPNSRSQYWYRSGDSRLNDYIAVGLREPARIVGFWKMLTMANHIRSRLITTIIVLFSLVLLLLTLQTPTARADSSTAVTEYRPPVVRSIEFEGDFKLKRFILQREIDSRVGESFDTLLVDRDRKKILSLGLFSEVIPEVKRSGDSVDVVFYLKEVWTLWPLIQVGRSDDSFDWMLGVREKNLLGYYVSSMVYYRRYESENSYGLSINLPRAFGKDLLLGFDLGDQRQVDPLGVVDENSGEIISADYRYLNRHLYARAGTRVHEKLYIRSFVGYNRENWTVKNDATRPKELRPFYDYPRYSIGAAATLGRTYYNDYFYEGHDLTASITVIHEQPEGRFSKWRLNLLGRYYLIHGPFNFAFRSQLGTSSRDERVPPFYISGVSNVRGFVDKIERGDHLWTGNAEIRLKGLESSLFYTQIVAFADAGVIWGRYRPFSYAWDDPYVSVGGGIRVGLKSFLARIGRFDVAIDTRTGDLKYYLGANQFF
jgi:outer membrane protein assembly factor BamA